MQTKVSVGNPLVDYRPTKPYIFSISLTDNPVASLI